MIWYCITLDRTFTHNSSLVNWSLLKFADGRSTPNCGYPCTCFQCVIHSILFTLSWIISDNTFDKSAIPQPCAHSTLTTHALQHVPSQVRFSETAICGCTTTLKRKPNLQPGAFCEARVMNASRYYMDYVSNKKWYFWRLSLRIRQK